MQLQESRLERVIAASEKDAFRAKEDRWEVQIKFGSGSTDDLPSDAVRERRRRDKRRSTGVHIKRFAATDACERRRPTQARTIADRAWYSACCA